MTNPIPEGTRCGCHESSCAYSRVDPSGSHGYAVNGHNCTRDAVRMVTVCDDPELLERWRAGDSIVLESVPMCAPCAAYAESKAGER